MKVKYEGSDERVFPTLGIIVKPGDTYELPDVDSAKTDSKAVPNPAPIKSASSDLTVGE